MLILKKLMASWNYCWEKVAGEKGTLLLSEPGFTGLNDDQDGRSPWLGEIIRICFLPFKTVIIFCW